MPMNMSFGGNDKSGTYRACYIDIMLTYGVIREFCFVHGCNTEFL